MLHHTTHFKHLLIIVALAVATAACDSGDPGPAGPAGPEGPEGPQGEQGPVGEDGNANVTVYLFDGHGFPNSDAVAELCLGEDLTRLELIRSSWNVYLGDSVGDPNEAWVHVPGSAFSNTFEVAHVMDPDGSNCGSAQPYFKVIRVDGTGHDFDQIRVFQTVRSNTEDCRGGGCLRASSEPGVPDNLDMTDYDAVVEYYGITEDDIVYM